MVYNQVWVSYAQLNDKILFSFESYLQKWLPDGKRSGSEYIAKNPARADHKTGSFLINVHSGKWADFATDDRGGDPISLYAYLSGLKYREAAIELEGLSKNTFHLHTTANVAKAANVSEKDHNIKTRQDKSLKAKYIEDILRGATSIAASKAELYLKCRKINLCQIPDLRFLQSHYHKPSGLYFPVILGIVRKWGGAGIAAVHRTYLSANGTEKAPVENAKMMLGSVHGGAVQLSQPTDRLAIGEGIETCLSVLQKTGIPTWAALSSGNIPNINLPPLPLAQQITIAADNDVAGRKAAYEAAEKWSREGRSVSIALPPLNKDFNDLLMEKNCG